MQVKSFVARSVPEVGNLLANFRAEGFCPTLSIVFSSVETDFDALQQVFSEAGVDIVGCTSAGEIVDDSVHESVIACMAMDMNRDCYRIFTGASESSSTYQVCFEAGQLARDTFQNPGVLLLSGGIRVDAEQLVFGVKDGVGREIPFFGGLAGDHLEMQKTLTFSNNFLTDDGIVCLILDTDRIETLGMATSGWEAIGAENLITKAEGNVVHTINDQPALDVMLRHFGFFGNVAQKGETLRTLNIQYPFQLTRESGDTVLRIPMFADYERRTITLAGGVREGERFRFSIAPGFEVVEKTVEEFSTMREKMPDADAVILFSCIGRHTEFGPLIDEEVQGLYNHWQAPMIGFFTYGEIGNTPHNTTEFHNETCALVTLREKPAPKQP
ncbi:MAG: FIST signal transduction protein [Saprospiraceae bacterium]